MAPSGDLVSRAAARGLADCVRSGATMNFEITEAQEILRQTVRRFLAESAPLAPYVRGALTDPRGTSDSVWRGLAGLGLTGLLVPEEMGGSALGMIEMGIVCEELGRAVHPGPFASSALVATSLLREVATDDEQRDLLPAIASGQTVATVAVYEPGKRYDWRKPATQASRRGDEMRLTGVKSMVGDAIAADVLLVVAHAPEEGRPGVFAVGKASEGLSIEASPSVDGTRKLATVVLDGTLARRLGSGDATSAVATALERAAVALAADGLGAAARAHELALDYARERQQFQRPIGSFQAVQHLLVDMLQDLELARAGIYYALWAADQADPQERRRAAAMAKAFASARLPGVGASAIQIFGGVGFTWEYDAHLFYKRVLAMQAGFGDEETHLDDLAALVVDAPSS